MIYLDNAATTYPKPLLVQRAVERGMKTGANPGRSGHKLSLEASEAVYQCRKAAAAFFHCDCPECVAFTLNCTHSINLVLKGLLKQGDHVVCTNLEHNAVMRPLTALSEKGITYTAVTVVEGDHNATVDNFRRALQKNTALCICTHGSNVTGVQVPVARIALLCREYGVPVAVDCAQTAGLLPIDMEEMAIDYLCAPGHKGLYGPMGTGLLLTRKGSDLQTILEGGTGTGSADFVQPSMMPEHLEVGTQNYPGIVGLRAGFAFLQQKKQGALLKQEIGQMQWLYDRLSSMPSIVLYTKRPTVTHHVPVLSFNVKDTDSETVGSYLNSRGIAVRAGLHCAPSAHRSIGTLEQGTVRVSPSAFTTMEELRQFGSQMVRFTKLLQNRF